jgi:acyl-coenzyme A thioesterase PaaI-like protein
MTERWTFGVEPLTQTREAAALLRRVGGLVVAMEGDDDTVARLIADLRRAHESLEAVAPVDLAPRVGADAPAERRVYLDHSRDIGSYNPGFPVYVIEVDNARATGSVTFPLAFEGPPGIVHGGVLATFFDCVIQHHNCNVGVAGKTTSLLVEYHRPTPLFEPLTFEIDRAVDDNRITSRARLLRVDRPEKPLCSATMQAVAGDRARLAPVSPRRSAP